MLNLSNFLITIGIVEFLLSLFIFMFDIIPKQIEEVHITRGAKGVDSTAIILLSLVLIKVFLLILFLLIFTCRRTLCGDDFATGYSVIINGTMILLLAFTWKILYRNYKKSRK